ncbi:MAG: ornithine cyclodeaminase family protein [Myxococcales bacterium]|nr:ornithine cyclodeaminase family protein [Myxococcales bacterium]
MLTLTRADVERLLDLDQLVSALERGFVDYSAGRCDVPPRTAARAPDGLLGSMPGYVPGSGLAVKLVSVFPRAEPSHQALIAIFDEKDGTPLAVMDGTYITAMRTAAASAISVKALSRPDAAVLAVIGAGVQGKSHLEIVPRVRKFREIRVASRSKPGLTFEDAVRGADVACLCTDAPEPVIRASWLSPGCHVTSVGVHREVGPDLVGAASIFVEWRGAAALPFPAGANEIQGCEVTELGEVLAGTRPGRRSDQEITLYKSTGFAMEDVVAAGLVLKRAHAGARF